MRKLVHIAHYECGYVSGITAVFAPEGKTEEDVEADIDLARDRYLKALTSYQEVNPPPEWKDLSAFPPDFSIGQALAKQREIQDAQAAYREAEQEATRSFEDFLSDLGYLGPWSDSETLGAEEHVVNWGHRHDQDLKYGHKRW